MKIYFAGAIRGGREDAKIYKNIIDYLGEKGQVLTEHIGNMDLNWKGEQSRTDEDIFNRDLKWLKSADIVVAEVTTPSLGVGYELGIAEKMDLPVLCLYRKIVGESLSAMIQGNKKFNCSRYSRIGEAISHIDRFINLQLKSQTKEQTNL